MAAQPTSDEELWTLQLAAVACLSIAAKMEEGIMPTDIAELQVDSTLTLLHDRADTPATLLHAGSALASASYGSLRKGAYMQCASMASLPLTELTQHETS